MNNTPTQESFLRNVHLHQITVFLDAGLYRHIRFAQPGTLMESFDLITGPGFLCYTGDMGTYVFRRVPDMFYFFRGKSPDLSYWSEKLEATDRSDGHKEWSMERFQELVREHVLGFYDAGDGESKALWGMVPDDVKESLDPILNAEDKYEAIAAIRNYDETGPVNFHYFWEGRPPEVYTYRFQWACFAIPWAIKMYDVHKERMEKEAERIAASIKEPYLYPQN